MDFWTIFLAIPLAVRIAVGVVLLAYLVYFSRMIVYIGNDSMGIVEKIWSLKGSVTEGFLSLEGNAGFQPELLRGGLHFFPPFQIGRAHV